MNRLLFSVNSNLKSRFAEVGSIKSGNTTISSGTSLNTLYQQTAQTDNTLIITSHVKFGCKSCDVATALTINDVVVYQRAFRGTTNFNPFDTIEKFVDIKKGDVIAVKACQNSGSDAKIEFDYNYRV